MPAAIGKAVPGLAANSSYRILFVPVSGPKGIGEYQRCLFLAQALLAKHPGWDVGIVVATTAPYVDEVPVPVFTTSNSPTLVPAELAPILREFRPTVAVFDSGGRARSMRLASELGARTVFISNHQRKRRRGFRLSRMLCTDEHWIMQPLCLEPRLWMSERLKLFALKRPVALFLGPVFPQPAPAAEIPESAYFLCCPGGGGYSRNGRQSGAVFMEAAAEVAGALDMRGVVVTGGNFAGALVADPRLQVYRHLPGAQLAALLAHAQFALVGGGDLLAQAVASRIPAVAGAITSDQPRRVAQYRRAGLCIAANPQCMADTAIAAYRDGRLEALALRLSGMRFPGGLETAVARVEWLAGCGPVRDQRTNRPDASSLA
jgi:hypothetical protein